jgi:hypothetical protein
MNTILNESGAAERSGHGRPGRRLDEIALALVLIMTGALWLAPKPMFPEGAWLVGVGLIVLGLNAARRVRGLKTSGFGIVVGLLAFAAGTGRIIGRDLPLMPILLIILGAGLAIRAAAGSGKRSGAPNAS